MEISVPHLRLDPATAAVELAKLHVARELVVWTRDDDVRASLGRSGLIPSLVAAVRSACMSAGWMDDDGGDDGDGALVLLEEPLMPARDDEESPERAVALLRALRNLFVGCAENVAAGAAADVCGRVMCVCRGWAAMQTRR